MAVKLGQEVRAYLGRYDLSLFLTTVGIGMEAPPLDRTVLVDSAERTTGDIRRDTFEGAGFFDDAAQSVDLLIGTLVGTTGVVSFLLGTTTGNRVYYGTVLAAAAKVAGRVGELVRVELAVTVDGTLKAAKHFGPKQAQAAENPSGSVDDSTGTSGTGTFIFHMFQLPATGTSMLIDLQDSADGTTWVQQIRYSVSTLGNLVDIFTGSLDRYVRVYPQYSGTSTGTYIYFAAYVRP